MEPILFEATKSTPLVKFEASTGTLDIVGESYPENSAKFYAPIFNLVNESLGRSETRALTVNIELIYFNSSSSKALMNLFDRLEAAAENGSKITLNWRYHIENETIQEFGEEFQEDFEALEFNLVAITDAG